MSNSMNVRNSILALVLAGGKGERLYPLTLERTKPSVGFGGKYRIIDFALSNLINSGIYSVYVLVQYKSQSLIEHIRTTWGKEGMLSKHFITVVPPQMRRSNIIDWYRGTADSVYQNMNLIYDFKPKLVAILAGDHIYRMNLKQMIDFHNRQKSDLTISVTPISSKEAGRFGVVEVDGQWRVRDFIEKPDIEEDKDIYASMGNYIFSSDILIQAVEEMANQTTTHDFGKDIIPYLVKRGAKVHAYDFSFNRIPAIKRCEERFYWRDVGNIENYWRANMDLLGRKPAIDLNNAHWPIYTAETPIAPSYFEDSEINNCLISEGAKIFNSRVQNSIIGRGVTIDAGCDIRDSIIMDFSKIGKKSVIQKAIIDRYNYVTNNSRIGVNRDKDKKKYYLDQSGIVVLRRGQRKIF
jgi:glucose-1-phosphate adenylyltransferase